MWGSFMTAFLFTCLVLYLPGYFVLRFCRFSPSVSIVCAPLLAVSSISLLGVLYNSLDLRVGWVEMILPLFFVGLICWLLRFALSKRIGKLQPEDAFEIPWRYILLYILIGLFVTLFVYVRSLDGPDSYAQIYDNVFHLSLIGSFVESGSFSVFSASQYVEGASAPFPSGGSFYPAAWHIICALGCDALNIPTALSENAVNTVFIGIVFPVSMCAFISKLFAKESVTLFFGAFCVLAFSSFPWGFLTFGPLYSNVAAFSLLPAVVFAFMTLVDKERTRGVRIIDFLPVVVGGISLAVSQPNAVFAAIIILSPYCSVKIYEYFVRKKGVKARRTGIVLAAAFFALILGFWVLMWSSPLFSNVVHFYWPGSSSVRQAVANVAFLSFKESPAQILLGFMVMVGIAYSCYVRKYRWLVCSYAIVCVFYIVGSCTEGVLRSLLTGFWYNDMFRVSAIATIIACPLAAMGLRAVFVLFSWLATRISATPPRPRFIAAMLALVFSVATYAPSHSVPGILDVDTPFGKTEEKLLHLSDPAFRKYTPEEQEFVSQVKSIVEKDPALVLNFPYDGSVFAYGEDSLDIFYRNFNSFGAPDESKESVLVRDELVSVSTNGEVRQAIESIGAGYLLLLDCCEASGSTVYEDLYAPKEGLWDGLLSVTDDTPGFELLLSDGGMRLYKIDI